MIPWGCTHFKGRWLYAPSKNLFMHKKFMEKRLKIQEFLIIKKKYEHTFYFKHSQIIDFKLTLQHPNHPSIKYSMHPFTSFMRTKEKNCPQSYLSCIPSHPSFIQKKKKIALNPTFQPAKRADPRLHKIRN